MGPSSDDGGGHRPCRGRPVMLTLPRHQSAVILVSAVMSAERAVMGRSTGPVLIVLGTLLASWPAYARVDQTCNELRAFYRAPFDEHPSDDAKNYRSVEMHWLGAWMDFDHGWKLECRDTGDDPGKKLCGWLTANTSFEFASYLPLRILECHGFRFPHPFPQIGFGHTEITLWDKEREVLLQIDFRERKAEDFAVRLTLFRPHHDEATDSLKPVIDGSENPAVDP
jgi:hypothetical protein